jgi:Protein of unknown function (DUF3551)
MRIGLIGLAALVAALVGGAEPAGAQYWQGRGSWCIEPPIGGGTWNCSFYNRWQCEQSVSGLRGSCVPSPAAGWERRLGKDKKYAKKKAKKQRAYD